MSGAVVKSQHMTFDSTEIRTTSGSTTADVAAEATTPPDAGASATAEPYDARTNALLILAGIAIIAVLNYAQDVLIPFVLSGLIFYALDPFVDRLQRWHVPRVLGAGLMLLLAVIGLGATVYTLTGQAMAVVEQLPEGVRRLRYELRPQANDQGAIDKVQRAAQELDQAAADATQPAPVPKGVLRVQVEEPALRASNYVVAGGFTAVALAGQAVMVLFLAISARRG